MAILEAVTVVREIIGHSYVFEAITAGTGLIGHYYVRKKNPLGYKFWIAGNACMMFPLWKAHMYVTVVLFVIYTVMSFFAIRDWEREERTRQLEKSKA